MFFDKIKKFHEKTMEQYRLEEEKAMEPWKKEVMRLHEVSEFLFYYEYSLKERKIYHALVAGDLVKGTLPEGSILYLYNGEGKLLGSGRLLGDPEEKEPERQGLLTHRRHQFLMRLVSIDGIAVEELEPKEYQRRSNYLWINLSLIADKSI